MTPQDAINDLTAQARNAGLSVENHPRLGTIIHTPTLSLGLLVIGNEVDLVTVSKPTGTRSVFHCRSDYLKAILRGTRFIRNAR